MKKAVSIILTVLLIASIACNMYLFMIYKTNVNALKGAKSETDSITTKLSEKEDIIEEANDTIADLKTTIIDLQISIDDLQKQVTEAKALVDEKEKELESIKESASNVLPSDTKETSQAKPPTMTPSNGNSQTEQIADETQGYINPETGEPLKPGEQYTLPTGETICGPTDWSDF